MCTEIIHQRRCRGTAEIELLFVIGLLLIPIFGLMIGASELGTVRLAGSSDVEWRAKTVSATQPAGAYAQVVSGGIGNTLVVNESNTAPIDGIAAVRPGLPNRFYEASASNSVQPPSPMKAVTIRDVAVFLDPSWNYASWPPGNNGQGDRPAYQGWFENYAGEDHPSDLVVSLGLRASWPP